MNKKFERKTKDQPLSSFGDTKTKNRDFSLETETIKDKQEKSK
ncbi:hypothetical protein LX97_03071 [Nonlabens dokdonensis]|mgnify:CR=1 FL=1|jgi:hypothetical protein|uniref:Uncharacterized protein n=2 Tax=Nonlabens dokdonensis TaxID=328515 RepID=L7WGC8_NONDD|nr:hypothetical protein [Nonlabens dokdonensis]AGC77978.1 hypothetical protein DDD_2851 [Nonlabens dokdonensis DSW-6]PZX37049.1 hypothetical protein LX97_03071 [Nonlabens dokdonensis]